MEARKAIPVTGGASGIGRTNVLHGNAGLVATSSPERERDKWIVVAAFGRGAG